MIQYKNKKFFSFLVLQSRVENALPDNMIQLSETFVGMLEEMSTYIVDFKEELKKEFIRLKRNSSNETESDSNEIQSVTTKCETDSGGVIDEDCNENIPETSKQKGFSRLALRKSIERTYTDDSLVPLTIDGAENRGTWIQNRKFKFDYVLDISFSEDISESSAHADERPLISNEEGTWANIIIISKFTLLFI